MHKLISVASAGLFVGIFSFASFAYAQVGIDVSGSGTAVDTDISADAGASADADGEHAESSTFEGSADSGASFSLSKKEASSASIDAESAELSADAVVTSEDLERYATSRMKRDAGIEHIEASSEGVSLAYRQKARFLGFIPASIRATAEVSGDGRVDVDYPWYRFLFSVDNSGNSDLEARVGEVISGADLSGGLNAHARAQLLDALHASLRGSVAA